MQRTVADAGAKGLGEHWNQETQALSLIGGIGLALTIGVQYLPEMPTNVWLALAVVIVPMLVNAARGVIRFGNHPKRVLIVLTNSTDGCDDLELVRAFRAFEGSDFQPVLASPSGGKAPCAPENFLLERAEQTIPLERCPARDFYGIFVVGGAGAAKDLLGCELLQKRLTELVERGGMIGGCGHGAAVLRKCKAAAGAGRTVELTPSVAKRAGVLARLRGLVGLGGGSKQPPRGAVALVGENADCAITVAESMAVAMTAAVKADLAKGGKGEAKTINAGGVIDLKKKKEEELPKGVKGG